ncbi:MAG: hypothetical protein JNK70_13795 [Phycisphaerae bacterium]|nr:hypothetical protein [Phycisphaerae bacterium]
MGGRIGTWWCLGFLLLLGCKGMFSPQGIPGDPLLSNGKPAESKVESGPPTAPRFSEPIPPANRAQILY